MTHLLKQVDLATTLPRWIEAELRSVPSPDLIAPEEHPGPIVAIAGQNLESSARGPVPETVLGETGVVLDLVPCLK